MTWVAGWLNRTLEVWRLQRTADGAGGWTTSYENQNSDVNAKVDLPSAEERLVAAQSESNHTHNIFLLPTADVQRNDELRGDSQTFEVISVVEPSTAIYQKAICELKQSGAGDES